MPKPPILIEEIVDYLKDKQFAIQTKEEAHLESNSLSSGCIACAEYEGVINLINNILNYISTGEDNEN